jgi:DNA replication licensing factor MCM2
MHQAQRHEQPEKVVVKLADLEEKVLFLSCISLTVWVFTNKRQAKEHDIFDVSPFLKSKVFAANGYVVRERNIEKHFKMD